MIRLELRTTPDRNSSKRKHYETRYTDLEYSRGLYRRKLNIEMKSQEETGTEMSSRVLSPQGGAAWSGPAPPGGEEPPDSVSCPFSSHDFLYLIKKQKY
jgi:hypothetical protein